MAKRSDLFDLIHSLTKSEKRYFRVYTSLHTKGEVNRYVQLFDVIDKQDAYDEDMLRKEFETRSGVSHFAEAKRYLYQTLLKALHLFHLEESYDSRIQMLIHQAEILYTKKLYRQFNKVLARAKELSITYERYLYTIDILSLQYRSLILEQDTPGVQERTEQLFEEILQYYTIERNHFEHWQLHSRMFIVAKLYGKPRCHSDLARYEQIMANDLMQEKTETLSSHARIYYYLNQAIYGEVLQNYESSILYYEQIFKEIFLNPSPNVSLSGTYVPCLYNICLMSVKAYREDMFFQYYPMLLECVEKQPDNEKYRAYIQTLTLPLHWHVQTGDFEQALKDIECVENAIRQFKGKLRIGMATYIDSISAYTTFCLGLYGQSLHYLNKILDRHNTDISHDSQITARLVFLIVQFELKNYDLLEYLLKSTYRYLASRQRVYAFETTILNFLKILLRSNNSQQIQQHFQQLYNELIPLQQDPFENPPFAYFDYLAWVQSKVQNRPFADIVREKFQQQKNLTLQPVA